MCAFAPQSGTEQHGFTFGFFFLLDKGTPTRGSKSGRFARLQQPLPHLPRPL
jgi:hypothetical protein